MRFINWLVEKWVRACPHDGGDVAADILEGCSKDTVVSYCRRCGGVRLWYVGQPKPYEWRLPQATATYGDDAPRRSSAAIWR